jgi:hypothetical protein
MVLGGATLFVSLFLTWSDQIPPSVLTAYGGSEALRGVPRNPTAWQVYSVADVLVAVLAAAVLAVALRGGSGRLRLGVLAAVALALAFVIHAASVPPTNGVLLINPASSQYLPRAATSGAGETVALVALALAATGLGVSLIAGRR